MNGNHQISETRQERWSFWIDRGGTFTDIVARRPDGSLATHKLLSENPGQYEDAAIQGIRDLMGLEADEPLPAERIEVVKMGTTVATNALLEKTGERVLLLITQGFGDALRIGYQNRPKLFERAIRLPEMLYTEVAEVPERMDARGNIVTPLDEEAVHTSLTDAYRRGLRAVAIVFMHAYRHPRHEKRAAEIAEEIGFTQISASHQVSPLMKLIGRGDTTVVDAYVSPVLRHYVDRVAAALNGTRLMFMRSSGGLTDAALFQGKDSILSGPAGGIVGAAKTSGAVGCSKIIGFDMGGTSTDVSHFAGEYERTNEEMVAGSRIRAPMMQIHTVAAGGGSVLHFDGSRFRVGPDSAGADPGPACYRKGGPLTVTDCNVLLGRLQPDFFPAVFGPDGNESLDTDTVRMRFEEMARTIGEQTGNRLAIEEVAEGFLRIAVENMANAIKKISTQRGYDLADYVLTCFGGAGGQHACRVADSLGMERILLHRFSGVLSAYGMGLAEIRALRQRSIEAPLNADLLRHINEDVEEMAAQARAELRRQGVADEAIITRCRLALKYQGTDSPLELPMEDEETLRAAFSRLHRQRFGFEDPDKPIAVERIEVEAIGQGDTLSSEASPAEEEYAPLPAPMAHHAVYADGWRNAPFYRREDLPLHARLPGPAVIIEDTGTIVVEPGWHAIRTTSDMLELRRHEAVERDRAIGTDADPIMLEVFNNLFMSIAEQMGATLEKTSHSVNVKERLDFSCAVFDHQGNLVANAPHMPVHLGSMSDSVRAVIRRHGGTLQPGDIIALNAPYDGGTHLPDITVITPVFDDAGERILFFTASRGHHADIGGKTPGSMPSDSTTITDEGVLFDNVKIVAGGQIQERVILDCLQQEPWPARNPDQNLADLKAQIAANEKGAAELRRMVAHFGLDVVLAYMSHVQNNAEEAVRRAIGRLRSGSFTLELDDGSRIAVAITVDHENRTARVDFTGTSAQRPNNFNAPASVCHAAVLYVFRTLVDDDIPMNEGCLKPLEIVIPEGSMLNPHYPAAVVAGNVETSQWITNALYGALGVMAAAQGTMNNLTFGNERYQYYETICGGAGAGADHDGASAVHTHMTNSRLTDPEVLEWRYPVLLERFAVRTGSGGTGQHRGGDGVIREIRFRESMTASILSSHRRVAPFGLNGGKAGKAGRNIVLRSDGTVEELAATATVNMNPDDRFIIETPGGGGYGVMTKAAE